MPITLQWDNDEHRVIRWVLTGELDWAELNQMMGMVEAMLDSVSHPVYMLALVEDYHLPPDTPMHFPTMAQKRYWQHPNLATTIVIGADHFFKMMVDIYKQVYDTLGSKIVAVQTLEDAYQLIEDEAQ